MFVWLLEWDLCYVSRKLGSVSVHWGDNRFELSYSEPISRVLEGMGEGSFLLAEDNERIHRSSSCAVALVCDGYRRFVVNNKSFVLCSAIRSKAVHNWLRSLKLQQYSTVFSQHDLEDFFALPFLDASLLDLPADDRALIDDALQTLRNCSPTECLFAFNKVLESACLLFFPLY